MCLKSLMYLVGISALCVTTAHADVKIYAAASLNNALTDIIEQYQQQDPKQKIVPVFAASSTLAKQIQAGAGSDIYFSADQAWMDYLIQHKKINSNQAKVLLWNQLVLIQPSRLKSQNQVNFSSNIAFDQSFPGYLCTGQMQSVPAGKYAQQSLQYYGWLAGLKGKIVETDDVRAALAFVERGECERGIVYKTDALISKKVNIIGTFPTRSHQMIVYPVALTHQGSQNPAAVKFYQYLINQSSSQKIFQHYGFLLKRPVP